MVIIDRLLPVARRLAPFANVGASLGRASFAAAVALASATVSVVPADAQNLSAPPPIFNVVDANGVNVLTGTFNARGNSFTIGGGRGGLAYSRAWVGSGWTDNGYNAISISGSTYTVTFGGRSESFTLSGGVYTPAQGQGSTLTYSATSDQYTYTAANGTLVVFSDIPGVNFQTFVGAYVASTSTTPDGVVTTYAWQSGVYCPFTSPCPGQQQQAKRLMGWSNNLGYSIIMAYRSNTLVRLSDLQNWDGLATVTGVNNSADNCFPGGTCGTLSTTYPSVTFSASPIATHTETDAMGRGTTYTSLGHQLSSLRRPSGLTLTIVYNGSGQVQTVSNGTGTWTYGYSAAGSTETTTVTDPLGHVRTYVGSLTTDLVSSYTDNPSATVSRTTGFTYDTNGRLKQITYPLGDEMQYAYDARGNVTTATHVPVAGSGPPNSVTSASFDATCTNPVKCNKPNTTTDPNGNVTNYTYDPTYGVLTKVDPPPAAVGATQPEIRYSYSSLYAYYYIGGVIAQAPSPVRMLASTSTCQTLAPTSCPGGADEVKTTFAYGAPGSANNLLPTSVSKGSGSGSLTATTSQTYDQVGDTVTATGPLGASQKTVYVYDFDRERLGVFGPEATVANGYPTARTTFNSDGLVTKVENGSDTSQTDSTFATFTSLEQHNTVYDGLDRVAQKTFTAGGTTYNVTQLTYDNANRLTCSAVRMNPAVFGSLPTSACTLGTAGVNGNDRITENAYDNADQRTSVIIALGDTAQAAYATYAYDPNGQLLTVLDANNNLTTNTYDGLDRLSQVNYPVATKGADSSSTTDFEAYTYDSGGNRLTVRRRSGDTITYTYDFRNRATEKAVPTWSGQNVFYSYDLLNRLTSATFGSLSGAGVSYGYDALSRKTSESAGGRTIASQYDSAGDRTQVTWPDSFFVDYVYDVLQRPTQVEENGATSGIGLLSTYAYDPLGRLTGMTRGNGANTTIGYDGADRIASLAHSFTNTTANVSWSFTYDAANGVLTRTATNDAYTSHPGNLSLSYVANGLNQYSSVSGVTYGYDSRANLTSDGTRTFTFDVDNKLLTGSAPTAATFTYDPIGRMQTDTASAATTTFLYDGDNLSAEYNSSGTVLRRYVPSGLGMDQPLVWYEGSGTTSRRWLHADNQDSIAAYSDASGNQAAAYGYDPYGVPAAWSGSRYAYTGQLMIPESLLYNYKARAYDPNLGRFLQSDPAGYAADTNLYAYVRNNPPNAADPSGMLPGDDSGGLDDTVVGCFSVSACSGGGVGGNPYFGPLIFSDSTPTTDEITVTAASHSSSGGGVVVSSNLGADAQADLYYYQLEHLFAPNGGADIGSDSQIMIGGGASSSQADPESAHDQDIQICRGLRTAAARQRCYASANARAGDRAAGRPVGPLHTWEDGPDGEPVPGPSPASRVAPAAGLAGVLAIVYWIVSEGSRVFPPRNVIPLP